MHALLLALLLPVNQAAPEIPPPVEVEISGWYTFGTSDEPFLGVARVTPRKELAGAYLVHWMQPDGAVHGVGLRDGNYLWVSWRDSTQFGICRYRIEQDKNGAKLVGDRGTAETMNWFKSAGEVIHVLEKPAPSLHAPLANGPRHRPYRLRAMLGVWQPPGVVAARQRQPSG